VFQKITTEELLGSLNEFEQVKLPQELYFAGRLILARKTPRIAIVGSRNASPGGLELAAKLAKHVVSVNGVVVSGLAKGIDRAAHEGALAAGGNTIAVLGTPLDHYYPAEHRDLQERMMREQLVLSQFAPGSPVHRSNFVTRNRTMALVSHATVIVEASEKSGTQSQAWEAIRLGRGLYIPEELANADFDWPRKLLQYGAVSFTSVEDLLFDPLINPEVELVW